MHQTAVLPPPGSEGWDLGCMPKARTWESMSVAKREQSRALCRVRNHDDLAWPPCPLPGREGGVPDATPLAGRGPHERRCKERKFRKQKTHREGRKEGGNTSHKTLPACPTTHTTFDPKSRCVNDTVYLSCPLQARNPRRQTEPPCIPDNTLHSAPRAGVPTRTLHHPSCPPACGLSATDGRHRSEACLRARQHTTFGPESGCAKDTVPISLAPCMWDPRTGRTQTNTDE